MWLEKLVRPEVLSTKAYSSARNENQNLDLILLDANESPEPPYGEQGSRLHRYPEPQPEGLRRRLCEIYGVESNQLLMTRGIDEGIDLLLRSFCRPGLDAIAFAPPTYSYYKVAAHFNAVKSIEIPQCSEFNLNWKSFWDLTSVKLIFICRPNNPTGSMTSLEDLKKLCAARDEESLVVVDEAYIEFCDEDSATSLLAECPNLVVMRTLSKAYGLAGLRLGSLIAGEEIIKLLKKVIPPYPIPTICAAKALEVLSPVGMFYLKRRVETNKMERELLFQSLMSSPRIENVFPSQGNFLLFTSPYSKLIYKELKKSGLVVRDRSEDVPNSLRVSVGTSQDNELLLAALKIKSRELKPPQRRGTKSRKTKETEIFCEVLFDSPKNNLISTGILFFDHMLEQLATHSGISLSLNALGDLGVDVHHTVEDVAIVLGESLKEALGKKRGIERYGFLLSMDESQTNLSLDLSGRAAFIFECSFPSERIGDFPTEMISHFFETLSGSLGAGIHIKTAGKNSHHMAEGIFKGFGRSLRQAVEIKEFHQKVEQLPSTKGLL